MSPLLEMGWTFKTASIKKAWWACFSVTPEAKLYRQDGFCQAFMLWEPSHHTVRKPRPQGKAVMFQPTAPAEAPNG